MQGVLDRAQGISCPLWRGQFPGLLLDLLQDISKLASRDR